MKNHTKIKLYEAWNFCDEQDKSTEFMFQYMADVASVSFDRVVDFVMEEGGIKRADFNLKQGLISKEQHAKWVEVL